MNSKHAKLLRKVAPRMGVTYESAKNAFNNLDPIAQIAFIKKAKERLKYYDKHNTDSQERETATQ